MTLQVMSRKAHNYEVNGVSSDDTSARPADRKTSNAKFQPESTKVIIRQLPPGLTETECVAILGDMWKAGNGKVSWFRFDAGKMARNPTKSSQPGSAYLMVTKNEELVPLEQLVKTSTWEDAQNSFHDPCLVSRPVLERALFPKPPGDKVRVDSKQGTIDLDPRYQSFLESLTKPQPREVAEMDGLEDEKNEKATTTPIIEAIREKKERKAKEAAAAKSAKHARQESQGRADDTKRKGKDKEPVEKAEKGSERPKETVKILTKKQATEAAAEAAKAVASQIQAGTLDSSKTRKSSLAAAVRILQRDLGLSPNYAHRKARQDAAKAESEIKTAAAVQEKESDAQLQNRPLLAKSNHFSATSLTPKSSGMQPAASSSSSRSRRRGRGGANGQDDSNGRAKDSGETLETPNATCVWEKSTVFLEKREATLLSSAPKATSPPVAPAVNTETTAPPATEKPAPTGPKAYSSRQPASQKKNNAGTLATRSATRAFLKHANPHQGVTEPLLKEVMSRFGEVQFVEIDRRKGFAYVDFVAHEGLVAAIAASPVGVASANVQVLERKEVGLGKKALGVTTPATTANKTAPILAVGGSSAPMNLPAPPSAPSPSKGFAGEQERDKGRRRRGRWARDRGASATEDFGVGSSSVTG